MLLRERLPSTSDHDGSLSQSLCRDPRSRSSCWRFVRFPPPPLSECRRRRPALLQPPPPRLAIFGACFLPRRFSSSLDCHSGLCRLEGSAILPTRRETPAAHHIKQL